MKITLDTQPASKIDTQNNCLILYPLNRPDWDEFVDWGKNIITQLDNCHFNQIDTGADRHKITFTFAHNRFSLNYETYTDSYWIETEEANANEGILELMVQLQQSFAML